MKLSGRISIDLPAGDYLSLAEHRRRLEDILSYVRRSYPDATMSIRERRNRRALQLAPAAPRASTGALNAYAPD